MYVLKFQQVTKTVFYCIVLENSKSYNFVDYFYSKL